mmetsp:Transcript_27752/g.51285  ORF Transcript_27752/g.51285 Transcript_27752/m.51285 type:complete len:227 (-) Transcript_27752:513-1193(-)
MIVRTFGVAIFAFFLFILLLFLLFFLPPLLLLLIFLLQPKAIIVRTFLVLIRWRKLHAFFAFFVAIIVIVTAVALVVAFGILVFTIARLFVCSFSFTFFFIVIILLLFFLFLFIITIVISISISIISIISIIISIAFPALFLTFGLERSRCSFDRLLRHQGIYDITSTTTVLKIAFCIALVDDRTVTPSSHFHLSFSLTTSSLSPSFCSSFAAFDTSYACRTASEK